jgi:hypothetical protein
MGTWAIDSFANDDAADLLGDLTEQIDLSPVREAIARVLESDGYVEAPDAQQCLAACEVLAAALNRPSSAAQAEEALMAWDRPGKTRSGFHYCLASGQCN